MILLRIKYIINRILGSFRIKLPTTNIDWPNVAISVISTVVILILSVNIFNVIKNGTERYSLIQNEVAKLAELTRKNEELKKDLEYKLSDDYVVKISLEQLNLAYPNSKVFLIKGNNTNISYVDIKSEFNKPTVVEKSKLDQWLDLFLKWN